MFFMDWRTAGSAGATLSGGKGWNLGRLARYGFAVPQGGVLSGEAYRLFMSHPDLQPHLAAAGVLTGLDVATPEGAAVLSQLRKAMASLDLPAAVMAELPEFLKSAGLAGAAGGPGLAGGVAVRSSATAEDSEHASFAGIHETFLNVTDPAGVAEAIRKCYQSLWTPQAVAYRRRAGVADQELATAVVIMEMVAAKGAGVGFSCDPRTGRLDRYAISATLGLGEPLVSGAVEPDEYLIDISDYPAHIVASRIGTKTRMSVALPGGGTLLAASDPRKASAPVLDREQLTELGFTLARIGDALGQFEQPQDVEWAHDGAQFWILQARPVTKLPPPTFPEVADQPIYWSNGNLRDAMPGVQSALGWSFFRAAIDQLISAPLQAARWRYPGGMTWARLFRGRAYLNSTALGWAMYDAIGEKPADTNRIRGGHEPEILVPPPTFPQQLRRRLGKLLLVRSVLQSMKAAPERFAAMSDWAEARLGTPCEAWSHQQFFDAILETNRMMIPFIPFFQIINSAAGGLHLQLIRALTPPFGERAAGLANAMLAGHGNVTSADFGTRLIGLGNLALAEPQARAFFAAPDWNPKAWATALSDTRFLTAFTAFLKEYGHRAVYELEPMNPRWHEEPTYLLETVRAQVRGGQELHLPDQRQKREAATAEVNRRLSLHPRRLLVRQFATLAGRAAGLREMAKSMVVKGAGVSRHYALALGNRLVAEGLLDERDDVFHLTYLDLWSYLAGKPGPAGFRALVADRKALRAIHLTMEPVDVIVGETPEKKRPTVPTGSGAGGSQVLTGLGVSAGQAAGRARVILHPDQGSELVPGEILVAPSTDPAWTPLFLRAAAVVMEVGGNLSHGAIVAREYGLPAVVNVPGLLQAIQTGDWLVVDGDAGQIRRKG